MPAFDLACTIRQINQNQFRKSHKQFAELHLLAQSRTNRDKLVDQSVKITAITNPDGIKATDTVTALRVFIKSGQYRPGDRLPSERDLIGLLGISRSQLRKAFDALEKAEEQLEIFAAAVAKRGGA